MPQKVLRRFSALDLGHCQGDLFGVPPDSLIEPGIQTGTLDFSYRLYHILISRLVVFSIDLVFKAELNNVGKKNVNDLEPRQGHNTAALPRKQSSKLTF